MLLQLKEKLCVPSVIVNVATGALQAPDDERQQDSQGHWIRILFIPLDARNMPYSKEVPDPTPYPF
jgi:hypothetical protein